MGELRGSQAAVLLVLRMADRPLLDEELVEEYARRKKSLMLPDQSDQSIRSRRSELAKMDPPRVVTGEKKRMSTGGTGLTWSAALPPEAGRGI